MDIEQLIELERSVWQALVEGDADADRAALSDDFLGVYPTGFAGRDDHVGQLRHGPTVAWYELSDVRMLAVDGATAMLAYRAEYARSGDGAARESMYVSSLWCRRDGRWVNVFSQDTPDTDIAVV